MLVGKMKPVVPVWICAVIFYHLLGIISTNSLKATYENEKLLCDNTTQAVSQIEKIPVDGPYGKDFRFKINCLPLNVCNETCEWSDQCTEKHYGSGVYISGIHSLFHNPSGERYLILLCCTADGHPDQCKPYNSYSGSSYFISAPKNEFIHQSSVNDRPEGKPWLSVQTCTHSNSNNESCATAAAAASGKGKGGGHGHGGGGGHVHPLAETALLGLGGLTGLVALGFVKGPVETITTATKITTMPATTITTTTTTPTTTTTTTPTTTTPTTTLTTITTTTTTTPTTTTTTTTTTTITTPTTTTTTPTTTTTTTMPTTTTLTTIPTTTATTTTPCPMNCMNAVCNDQPSKQYQGFTRLKCQSACLANPKCAAWDLSGSRCSIYYTVCTDTGGIGGFGGTNPNLIYCERDQLLTTCT